MRKRTSAIPMPPDDVPFDDLTVPQRVRRLRGNRSHDSFAKALGTSRQTVIAWEKEGRGISDDYRAKLAAEGGCSPDDFVSQEEPPDIYDLDARVSVLEEDLDRLTAIAEAIYE